MRKKTVSLIITSFLTALAITGCGSKTAQDTAPASQSGQELKEIVFVLDWTPNTNHSGVYVAIDKGYYEEEGLSVTVVQPPDDGARMLVGAGKAHFGVDFQDYMAPSVAGENALPITAVAAIEQHNISGIISRKGEGIDTPKGLEGKKYATWDLDVEKSILKNVVEKDGGDWDKVELIPSTVTDEASALKSKSVDAIWVFYGWAGIACDVAGVETDYFSFSDINPVFDYYSPVIIANTDFLKEDPDSARAFLRATAKGYGDCVKDPSEATDILIKLNPELKDSRELVQKSHEFLADEYIADAEKWGVIDAARWNAFYNWLNENKLVENEIPENTAFTNDYLP